MSVHFDQVSYVHPNGFVAIKELSLHLQPSEHIALIGPSGAGKTTLLSLIGTGLQPTNGSLTVLGQHMVDVENNALCQLRKRIAFIYQHPPLPPRQRVITAVTAGRLGHWPVWKSLASFFYPMDIPGASEVLSRVQLNDKLFDLCDQLSGGQLQRVGIARALYQQSELILADEPVSALDPGLALAMVDVLKQEAGSRGATLVASLHAVDLALKCFERIIGLRDGKIVFDLPAHKVTSLMLEDLYANESPLNTTKNNNDENRKDNIVSPSM